MRKILTQCYMSLLSDLEQMTRSVFYLVQFTCCQINPCLSKKQARSAIEMRRSFFQSVVQFKERNLFLPAGLV